MEEVEGYSLYRTLIEEDPFPYSDRLHQDFLTAFGKDDVRQVLLRLPENYRAPLVLKYMEGFAHEGDRRACSTHHWGRSLLASTEGASGSSGRCGRTQRKRACSVGRTIDEPDAGV